MDDLVIAGAQGLEFRPAIDFALNKSARLNRFQHAIVVKISETRIPGKAATGKSQLFTVLNVGSNTAFHLVESASALPEKMAFSEAKSCGDIAHIDIEQTVPIHIAEIAAHSFERIVTEHARFRGREIPFAFQFDEFQMTGGGTIVQ